MKRLFFVLNIILIMEQKNIAYSPYPYQFKGYGIYYGTSYHFDKTYHHHFSLEKWKKSKGGSFGKYKYNVWGINTTILNTSNYNLGIRYLQTIHPISSNRYNNFFLYLSGQTSFFSIEHQQGITFFPHIGVHYNSIKTLDFDLFYGYNIPFINQKSYNNNPHQLTLKIGVKVVTNSLRVR